jgi:bifunctional UDP-N-acetylglucosamine pyrophosphorylase/glucosamine-1-phosphate N-acetyltransferase
MKRNLHALVLAAGKSTRFKSKKAKVLHTLLGKTMLQLVVESVSQLKPEKVHLVVGHQKESIMAERFARNVDFVVQSQQLGTAHAVLSAKTALKDSMDSDLLVINGDLPLIRPETLRPFLLGHRRSGNSLTFLTAEPKNPFGFGRVVRTDDGLWNVVEEREATPEQKKIGEVNVGIYLFKTRDLFKALPKVSNQNKKREYYVTDLVEILSLDGKKVDKFKIADSSEVIGVNDRSELAAAVDALRIRKIESLAASGVTIYGPATTWIDLDVEIESDTIVYPSVLIEGQSVIGRECQIYPFVHIIDSKIGRGSKVLTSTVIEKSILEDKVSIGPFCRLRPESVVKKGARVGNFVEMKKTVFGEGSKAGHLSYLGDAQVEKSVNIGAGTIFCNYDGEKKHKTHIEEGAFIGSGTELVAPIKIGKGAYIGAGSTITKNVSPGALAVERSRQIERKGWGKRRKKK